MSVQIAPQNAEKKIFTNQIGKALFENFGINGTQLRQYEEVFGNIIDISTLVKVINELGDAYASIQSQYRKLPTVKQILKAFWDVKKSSNVFGEHICNYCNNTGYVWGLQEYHQEEHISNKQVLGPMDQIEKIAFECFCGRCRGKNLENIEVREKRILKYGWNEETADKFIEDCKKLVHDWQFEEENKITPQACRNY